MPPGLMVSEPTEERAALGDQAVVRLDGEGRIVEATRFASAILGYEPHQICGRSLADLAAEGWRAAADVASTWLRLDPSSRFGLMMRARDGGRRLIDMRVRGRATSESLVVSWSRRQRGHETADGRRMEAELRRFGYALLLRGGERQREKVARCLEQEVAPLAVAVRQMIEEALRALEAGEVAPAAVKLRDAAERLRVVSTNVYRVASELYPRILKDVGLVAALGWYLRTFEQSCRPIKIDWKFDVAESEIPPSLKRNIFRIVEEAMTNVAQHSRARSVALTLQRDGDQLQLTIKDDGVGFDPEAQFRTRTRLLSMGLAAIRNRVHATGGSLILETAPRSGTRVAVSWKRASQAGSGSAGPSSF